MKQNCVFVYMNLGPYHIARLRVLAEILPDMHVIEVAAEQILYPWRPDKDHLGFNLTTLFPGSPCENAPTHVQRGAIKSALSLIDPTVVVVAGYREPVMREAAKWARKRRRPTVLLFPSTCRDHPRMWWKELLKSRLVMQYTIIAATGARAAEYAELLGFPNGSVVRVGNAVDNSHFSEKSDAVRSQASQGTKIPALASRYFVTVSRLSPEKNLSRLIIAFAKYRGCGGSWDLVVVGGGPLEGQLRTEVQELGIPGVHFAGWKSYEELPYYYTSASCFVLASLSETWGLVVNEAMACGLPVLVSENCGCVPELCRSGENGYTFDPNSTEDLVNTMLDMSSNDERLLTFGQASRRIISSFTPQTWAAGLRDCVTTALDRRKL